MLVEEQYSEKEVVKMLLNLKVAMKALQGFDARTRCIPFLRILSREFLLRKSS